MDKKAEMPFWLVIMIVSLVFGFLLIMISSGSVKDFMKSLTNIKEKTTSQQDCLVPANSPDDSDGDGLADNGKYKDESGQEQDCDLNAP
ncbi:hypothetical protein HZA96_04095 [Candidatus Woesearchaeota archaeon]|nr:hypothetical protein [Candidatus Woesearchaeota archaeon]